MKPTPGSYHEVSMVSMLFMRPLESSKVWLFFEQREVLMSPPKGDVLIRESSTKRHHFSVQFGEMHQKIHWVKMTSRGSNFIQVSDFWKPFLKTTFDGACGCSYRSEKKFIPIYSAFGMFHRSVRCLIESFDRLTALCFLSVSHAQLMRRAESHGRRGSRLQGALREALAKVTAEQVLFVEENFLGKNWWWVMSGDAKWFANIKGFIFWMHMLLPSLSHSHWKKCSFWCLVQTFPGNIWWSN